MSGRLRLALFGVAAAVLAGVLIWGMTGLPPFGERIPLYGLVINRLAVEQTGALNAVAAVLYDYRALDTLGEEMILFAAVLGAAVLLREVEEGSLGGRRSERPPAGEAVRWTGPATIAAVLLFAAYLTAHGHLSPGGGFQGGSMAATAVLLIYLTHGYGAFSRIAVKSRLDPLEAVGLLGILAVGLITLAAAGSFLENALPKGRPGELLSAGTIPILSVASAVAVAAGLLLILAEFLEERSEDEPTR